MENKEQEKKNKDVVKLGDGEVFIKRTSTGAIKAIKARLVLREREGHLAVIQGKAMITATGYNEMNKIAGVSIITPEKLTLPSGDVVVNPFPIIDKESGTIDKVWVKKIGIGFSPIGNLVMTSSTLLYDIRMYFIQDLNKKVQTNKSAGRMCMETMLTDEEKKRGMFLPIQGKMGIWVDLENKDVLKCMDTYIQNKLFAERKAQTIAERNVLKKHPALSQVYVEATGPQYNHIGAVSVVGYTHDLNRDDLQNLASMAEKGEDLTEYKGVKVDVIDANVIDEVEEEDLYTARDEEEITPEPEQLPQSTAQPMQHINIQEREKVAVENQKELREEIEGAKAILGEEEFNNIIKENFRKEYTELTAAQLRMAKTLVNSKMDKEVEF
ncbi:hypothetical protein [Clostridium botulinum]|uniref:hypothetical protein n=1 Tax=Clostridium botulinum TaxID=1491 RepID=UPI001C9A428D|nr:hypothetical protein [Clostridium botulinum]MBY6950307.1 hypothetical protein [Clostridium botulinum]MCR1138556.1 heat shock 70 family protein [Clostridium botulinum]